jgi:DmsE family decaheme c-type cytochrome
MMRVYQFILTTWAVLFLSTATALAQTPAPVPVSNEVCKACHVPYDAHKVNIYHSDCLACHTPETKHLTEDGKGSVQFPTADNCLACHKNNDHKRMNWAFSAHKKAGVECRNCHGIHSPKIKEINVGMWKSDKNSMLCMSCHKDVAARMNMPSHHPVKEGGLSCVSCHDPHSGNLSVSGPVGPTGLTSLVGKNEQCAKCHQNVSGPKVFEHAPVVEDCTICHNPHGSPNRRLMQLAQPMQCLQCHSLALNKHTTTMPDSSRKLTGTQLRNCTNCHSAIHGSHSDPKLKY